MAYFKLEKRLILMRSDRENSSKRLHFDDGHLRIMVLVMPKVDNVDCINI